MERLCDTLPADRQEVLVATAKQLTHEGKGLLAADESTGTIGKRLEKSKLENTEEIRRDYRELFLTADICRSVSGVILYKETLAQSTAEGTPFVDALLANDILPGIKVDEGLTPLSEGSQETQTKGLENLEVNCEQYYGQGARFAKWRAALKIGQGMPSAKAIEVNSEQLAEYAAIAQRCGLVPIVEPELLIDGTHDILTTKRAAERTMQSCMAALWRRGVILEAVLLKPQMVVPGSSAPGPPPSTQDIAHHTLDVLYRSVPPAVAGIMFLSGGQSEREATENLNAINQMARHATGGKPCWHLSFSFGRAMQASVLQLWVEDRGRRIADVRARAQAMAARLASANGAAAQGTFTGAHPSVTSGRLEESFRGWSAQGPTTPPKIEVT
ncbi:hypothetical protein WJX73_007002 [Symbiochloris irregularis]|uniref:fructose-bisphosphate aldolase n=1 Tax=Symbiochloris irregularis TaxID=706552 RepID=A0AAW1P9N2_9CHLO